MSEHKDRYAFKKYNVNIVIGRTVVYLYLNNA